MNRCDWCLDDKCEKNGKCNCSECKLVNECYKFPRPTIRITNKCTQECTHCCFESSPKSKVMMTLETALNVGKFLKSNEIPMIQVMGGEFFCNKQWYKILNILVKRVKHMRLVTNGDWVAVKSVREKFAKFIDNNKDVLTISLSFDKYHTNKHFEEAKAFLENTGVRMTIGKGEEESDAIVPVGRGELHFTKYSMFNNYCYNPEKKYTFLIDEYGAIYKCAFGRWQYDTIDDYLEGGFAQRFKEYNKKFYKVFIPNCKTCNRFACQYKGDKTLQHRTVAPI